MKMPAEEVLKTICYCVIIFAAFVGGCWVYFYIKKRKTRRNGGK